MSAVTPRRSRIIPTGGCLARRFPQPDRGRSGLVARGIRLEEPHQDVCECAPCLHLSVIIGYFDLGGTLIGPSKTDPPLIVDPDAPLTDPVPLQTLQTIAWWGPKVGKSNSRIEHVEFPRGHLGDAFPLSRALAFQEKGFGSVVREASDHGPYIIRGTYRVKASLTADSPSARSIGEQGDESGPIRHRMPLSSLGDASASLGEIGGWHAQARTPQGTAHQETLCTNDNAQTCGSGVTVPRSSATLQLLSDERLD